MRIKSRFLGQSGFCLEYPKCTVYVDPYLSNSVQLLDAPDLIRQIPVVIEPERVADADFVLITHEHLDHCDPYTLPQLAKASPQARFVGPANVIVILRQMEISPDRLILASENGIELVPDFHVYAIPAAHPEIERDELGNLAAVGYILNYEGQKIYLAGDTLLRREIIDALNAYNPIHTAVLPVNEHNFFRDRRGVVGNMSVREAFGLAEEIGVKQLVPVHWDMFAINETLPKEMLAVYNRMQHSFSLLMQPDVINLADVCISVIIRTLNEATHLDSLLRSIAEQEIGEMGFEVIIVDSGSTDGTIEIAEKYGCRVLHISREDFSYGCALNMGCASSNGDFLVFISGHCVPADVDWLKRLVTPLVDGNAHYTYGRQLGCDSSHFSEKKIFSKYFPETCHNGQKEYYCNNANAALLFSEWERLRFDEDLTGLEDMELAQRLVKDGGRVSYVPDAAVYHCHQENWAQIQRRFEREALALQRIMPNIHVGPFDLVRYVFTSVMSDWLIAWSEGAAFRHSIGILRYRWHQYRGVYLGNNQHRKLSHKEKEKYFYPK